MEIGEMKTDHNGTKLHINLDIPKVHIFGEQYDSLCTNSIVDGHPNKIQMIQVQQLESINKEMKKNCKIIKELQDCTTTHKRIR
ncbi:3-dehydroquinate synthase [Bienertia sinuspersici]